MHAETEMSMRRTGLSFQRTKMSSDRTLMAAMRTALSLISFGFAIAQVDRLQHLQLLRHVASARGFGAGMVAIGLVLLVLGIAYHVQFMLRLRATRARMVAEALAPAEGPFPLSVALLAAVFLLAVGGCAIASLWYRSGPFA